MKIDYVITWVDGTDPAHLAQQKKYKQEASLAHKEATKSERFIDNGEIYYHIASILKYAPFINHIYIITDNQKPAYLNDFHLENKCAADFISVISHDEIFRDLPAKRPNYNSLSIESALWRIPELSEFFVYANDDFFINGPVTSEDFFKNGFPILSGAWTKNEDKTFKYKLRSLLRQFSNGIIEVPKFLTSLWKGAKIAGFHDQYFQFHHHPHPLRKSKFISFFEKHPEILNEQVSYRFRSACQFNPVSLINHLELSDNLQLAKPVRELAYIDVIKPKKIQNQIEKINDEKVPFGCIQGFELLPKDVQINLTNIMINKFKDYLPSSFKLKILSKIKPV